MKDKSELALPEELFYSKDHVWARPKGDLLEIGISDYGQDRLGRIVFIELPEKGKSLKTGEEAASIESVKAVNGVFMPVDGLIEEINEDLENDPAIINESCYEKGWIARIRPKNPDDVKKLMRPDKYADFLD